MSRNHFLHYAACAALTLVALATMSSSLLAQGIDTPDPSLPPDGEYLTADDVHTRYNFPPVIDVLLERPEHRAIVQEAQRHAQGPDEVEDFPSTLQGTASGNIQGVGAFTGLEFNAFGPVQTIVFGKVGNTTGTFQTEMLSMNLTGSSVLGPFLIRESPLEHSTGQTTITDIGGGMYHIDSFFDVFTELSLDNGANWIPSDGPSRVNLVPEPSSFVLWGLGAIGIAGFVRRRRRAG